MIGKTINIDGGKYIVVACLKDDGDRDDSQSIFVGGREPDRYNPNGWFDVLVRTNAGWDVFGSADDPELNRDQFAALGGAKEGNTPEEIEDAARVGAKIIRDALPAIRKINVDLADWIACRAAEVSKAYDIDAKGAWLAVGDTVRFVESLPAQNGVEVKAGDIASVAYALEGGLIFKMANGGGEVSWNASAVVKED